MSYCCLISGPVSMSPSQKLQLEDWIEVSCLAYEMHPSNILWNMDLSMAQQMAAQYSDISLYLHLVHELIPPYSNM